MLFGKRERQIELGDGGGDRLGGDRQSRQFDIRRRIVLQRQHHLE